MQLKKFLLFGLIAAALPAVAEEVADRKTATSLKYVEHELDTRQNKFGADNNKAMEYTNAAGDVQKRAVTSDLDNGGTESLPMVGGVNTKLNQKQDDIAAVNDHTAVTYTGTAGQIGRKGIYQTTGTYADQSDNLIDAKTFNAALKNGLDREFVCSDNRQPVTGTCWLWEIHNGAAGHSLPDGYTELKWIESDGHQYIDTGVVLDQLASEVFIDFQKTTDAGNVTLMGCQSNANSYNLRQTYYFAGGALRLYNSTSTSYSSISLTNPTARHTIHTTIDNENNITIDFDGTIQNFTQTRVSDNTLRMFLFANNIEGVAGQKISAKVYRIWIKDASGTFVFNGFPARQNSDNKVGMYDTVSRRFFPSVPANTNFAAGPEVSTNVYIPQNQ